MCHQLRFFGAQRHVETNDIQLHVNSGSMNSGTPVDFQFEIAAPRLYPYATPF